MKNLASILLLTLFMFVVCGVIYPLITTVASQTLFNYQANGSLLTDESGNVIASELIGQEFTSEYFFTGRPSQQGYSGDSIFAGQEVDFTNIKVPVDNYSASGLEPYILYDDAIEQIPSVSKASGISEEELFDLVDKYTITNLTSQCVNIMLLNYEIYNILN